MLVAATAAAFTATAAMAAVSFDETTGTGFVGKGDVQLAFGWNNRALQTNASGVSFTYKAEETYSYGCTFTIVIGRDRTPTPQTVTRGKETAVNGTIVFEARSRNQINGFNLTGFGTTTVTGGEEPVEGGYCPGGPLNDGTISNVVLTSSTGGLFVNFGGTSIAMPNTPVL